MAKESTADRLIKQAASRRNSRLPAAARSEIAKIIAHNDNATRSQRVSRAAVVDMLEQDYGLRVSTQTLDRWLREEFGRGI